MKLHKIPAHMADPITPEELQAMACIKRKLEGSSFWPMRWTSLAEPGTAETPAAPRRGLIFDFENRFISLAKRTPDPVAMLKATAPNAKMPMDFVVRNTSAWVEAPTVNPKKMVAVSIMAVRAVLANRSTTPETLKRLPKKKVPRSGMEAGARKQHRKTPMTGKIKSSFLDTGLGSGMWINRSSFVVRSFMMGG